ncbi:MAG TPA: site-specific integrase [Pirellulales bacterium]|nr:site-specific integrase [Pirellulales bacterium]
MLRRTFLFAPLAPFFARPASEVIAHGDRKPSVYSVSSRAMLNPHWHALSMVAFDTGARLSEITQVRRTDVDFAAGVIILPGEVTKNGQRRILVLSSPTVAAVAAIWDPTQSYLFHPFRMAPRGSAYRRRLAELSAHRRLKAETLKLRS